jgi:hypothetical protein
MFVNRSQTFVEVLRLPNPVVCWVLGRALSFSGLVIYVLRLHEVSNHQLSFTVFLFQLNPGQRVQWPKQHASGTRRKTGSAGAGKAHIKSRPHTRLALN